MKLSQMEGPPILVSLDSVDTRRRKKGGPFQLKVWNQRTGTVLETFGRYTPAKKDAKVGEETQGNWEDRTKALDHLKGCLQRYEEIGLTATVRQLFPEV
ncbi:hypothetical protein [Candidatus Cyanaurora vandensis]|uniref:hypothetical protein n=1 Tax=Candidatus Cyanaurora vandensis TaxID=2714958 RepID=UPI00257976DA|nr:hypothetical protein [Candidatus Cyanaurora vandensis]